ncbi:MAG: type I-C CRISPR-associated protein Cas8c/Csd1 [Bacteroidales bacterium]|nr:type I-C CRISPR-associated protein Cas8c/Csd1 [Bacteroidales bacterium]
MSWIEELYRTYDYCSNVDDGPTPPYHMRNNTHIEIRIDGNGNFIGAKLDKLKNTIIPCTEKSEAARTMNPPAHPLCDKIQFVAGDYKGSKTSYFDKYIQILEQWSESEFSHPMVKAIYTYTQKRCLIEDLRLYEGNILSIDEDPADLFVRWCVEIPGENETRTWKCKSLYKSWQDFYEGQESLKGLCMVRGEKMVLALNHPKRIRHGGDGAKLISSNDKSGFTFRGRFTTNEVLIDGKKSEIAIQSATISAEVSQKVHRVLGWLIEKQSYRNGDQVIVSWSVTGEEKPNEFSDTNTLFGDSDEEKIAELNTHSPHDAGQTFAQKLSKKIAGYRASLTDAKKIVVMGLDSANQGRISITYYRELAGSEFLDRVEKWHSDMAWHFYEFIQDPKEKKKKHSGHIVYAPAPRVIAESCFGKRLDDKLKKSTTERLLPCIIDGRQVPEDLVNMAIKRASNKIGIDHWEWERTLSVACALYSCQLIRKNNNNKIQKIMALEKQRTDRDYLFGRLLAVAEHLEEIALNVAKEPRETTAARLMQRFADFPYSTWRTIESSLVPYKSRLNANRPGFLVNMKNLMDEIHTMFLPGDFENDNRLSGAYLLGYHCQRFELKAKKTIEEVTTINS